MKNDSLSNLNAIILSFFHPILEYSFTVFITIYYLTLFVSIVSQIYISAQISYYNVIFKVKR